MKIAAINRIMGLLIKIKGETGKKRGGKKIRNSTYQP
jgi:hypothetical protein